MTRLSNEDYNRAVGILKRYNYNCINILNIRADILSLSVAPSDGQPKAPYNISDTVFNSVLKLQEDKNLNKSIKEYKIVQQALALLNNDDINYIFENLYRLNKSKYDIIDGLHTSEETYKRRKRALIYAVHNEIIKSQ